MPSVVPANLTALLLKSFALLCPVSDGAAFDSVRALIVGAYTVQVAAAEPAEQEPLTGAAPARRGWLGALSFREHGGRP